MRKTLSLCLLLTLSLALATPVLAQGSMIHVVQPGENLFRIALRHGVTVNALTTANNLSNPRLIYVGQQLIVPTASGSAPAAALSPSNVHVVQPGENLFRIGLRYGVNVNALATANGIVNTQRIYAGQRLVIPGQATASPAPAPAPAPAASQTYIVRHGDTLSAIALRYGVSVWALAQANGIRNPSLIYTSQALRIPGNQNTPASSAPPAAAGDRWIDIDLSAQRLTAYEGGTPVRSTLVSTGLPSTPTPTGQYRTYIKYASASMSGPGYYLANVPYVMYFYRSYALHGTYWHANFGQPMSHGCVNLPTSEAQWLYSWAPVGILIKIHY